MHEIADGVALAAHAETLELTVAKLVSGPKVAHRGERDLTGERRRERDLVY